MEYYFSLEFLYIFLHDIHMGLHVLKGCSFPYILKKKRKLQKLGLHFLEAELP